MKKILTADFETTTTPEDCRVWAYAVSEVGNPDYFKYGNRIDNFIDFCCKSNNALIYFHNLKFDGEFIMSWLFEHGFAYVKDKKELRTGTFTTLISDKGQFYTLKICFNKSGHKTKSVTFYDSLKILPFKIEQIAKDFGLPISKLKIDYKEYREEGHELTKQEIEYIKNDVQISAMAIDALFKQDLTKMTVGSNALSEFKEVIGEKWFNKWFPVPYYDSDIRRSYKGGFTYLNHIFKDVDVKDGIVLDVNSLYPYVMHEKPLPYGEGIYFNGKYKPDKLYNLYVQSFTCQFELKENHIPTVQIKNNLRFVETEYLTSSGDEPVNLTMTNVDLELFFKHYKVYNIEYHDGWKFKSSTKIFKKYIDKWSNIKIESKKSGNKAMYVIAKLMLNSLYGKFALNPRVRSKHPYYNNGMIKYQLGDVEHREPIYIPVGTFITSWARFTTISSAQTVYDRFVYADTDSLHLTGTELPSNLQIDDTILGAWKHENTFKRARFLRQKCYFESHIIDDKTFGKMEKEEQEKCYYYDDTRVKDNITVAGLPENCYKFVSWENFHEGVEYSGKLQAKRVKGGVILNDTTFKIKPFLC